MEMVFDMNSVKNATRENPVMVELVIEDINHATWEDCVTKELKVVWSNANTNDPRYGTYVIIVEEEPGKYQDYFLNEDVWKRLSLKNEKSGPAQTWRIECISEDCPKWFSKRNLMNWSDLVY